MRKINIIIGSLGIGGTEQHLVRILPSLKALGWQVCVFAFSRPGPLERLLEKHEIDYERFTPKSFPVEFLRKIFVTFQIFYWLFQKIKKEPDSIIHFFLPFSYILGLPAAYCARHRGPKIMSRRSLNVYQQKYPGIKWVEKVLHHFATFILGNAQAVVKQLEQEEGVSPKKLKLIYNGIAYQEYQTHRNRADLRLKYGLKTNAFVMILVANLIPYKGHEDLLNALNSIKGDLPLPWQLICIGRDQGILKKLQSLSQTYGLENNIQWLGETQGQAVIEYYQLSNIGILCSHEEGFSNAILEAMAAGLPMVVTDVGGNKEAVLHEQNGLVVPARQPDALGQAILNLAHAPDKLEKFSAFSSQRVAEAFSLEACVSQYHQFYQALCVA